MVSMSGWQFVSLGHSQPLLNTIAVVLSGVRQANGGSICSFHRRSASFAKAEVEVFLNLLFYSSCWSLFLVVKGQRFGDPLTRTD